MEEFKSSLVFSREDKLEPSSLGRGEESSLYEPDLREIWEYTSSIPRLGDEIDVQQGHQFHSEEILRAKGLLSSSPRSGWLPVALKANDNYSVWQPPLAGWLNFGPKTYRPRGGGAKPGQPQVVINYAGPVQAWRFRPVTDREGIATSSRFLVFHGLSATKYSLVSLWSVLLSPIANAYAYSWSSKRQTLVIEWLAMPLPSPTPAQRSEIEAAAASYLSVAVPPLGFTLTPPDQAAIKKALLNLDAAVLRLYNLPPHLERQLLAIFDGVERPGVGCIFRGYPPGWSSRPVEPSLRLPTDERPIWERIASLAAALPEEVITGLPSDGASQLDHYLYGASKRT
jgi:hypothetical protein